MSNKIENNLKQCVNQKYTCSKIDKALHYKSLTQISNVHCPVYCQMNKTSSLHFTNTSVEYVCFVSIIVTHV